jgi:hypothetical protein
MRSAHCDLKLVKRSRCRNCTRKSLHAGRQKLHPQRQNCISNSFVGIHTSGVSFFVSVWLLLYCRQCEFTEKKSISGARGSRVRAPALCVDAGGHPSETQEAQLWTKKRSARRQNARFHIFKCAYYFIYTQKWLWLSGGSTPMPLIAGVWHIQSGGPCGASATRQSHSAEKIRSRTREDLRKCAPKVTGRLFLRIFFTLVATQCAK